jgi:hypothetical protein
MKKLLMILTVTAFAVVANAGDACCAAKKEAASADKATCSAKAATCSAKSEASASCCKGEAQKVATKQLKSPRHASQS